MNTDGMSVAQVEAKGVEWAVSELLPPYQKAGVPIIDTRFCRQRELMQRTFGDLITMKDDGEVCSVELKTERRHTGNLFLESWSNLTRIAGYRRDGWLYTLQADVYINIFLDVEVAYVMPLPELRRWAVEDGNA